jgi:CDP-glycerol glycerophosphotransferase (TagB/SpsB family)
VLSKISKKHFHKLILAFKPFLVAFRWFSRKILRVFFGLDNGTIWVLGSRKYEFVDNSAHFFRYLLGKGEKNVFYISYDVNNNHFISPKSIKAYLLFFAADFVLFTHSLHDILSVNLYGLTKAKKVWLKHGITGIKAQYQDKGTWYYVDKVISCSDFEKKLISRTRGVDLNKIIVTGFPRHDVFSKLNQSMVNRKLVLFAPTVNETDPKFLFNKISEVDLFCKKNNLTFKVWIHPYFDKYLRRKLLADWGCFVCSDPDPQSILLSCNYFISDYSSLLFDAAIFNKKIIIFAPDYHEYSNNRGFYSKFKKGHYLFIKSFNCLQYLDISDINFSVTNFLIYEYSLKAQGGSSHTLYENLMYKPINE